MGDSEIASTRSRALSMRLMRVPSCVVLLYGSASDESLSEFKIERMDEGAGYAGLYSRRCIELFAALVPLIE